MEKINQSNKVSPARRVAFEILRRVLVEQAFASNLLSSAITSKLSSLDRALAQEIVLGTIRYQYQIDHFLKKFYQKPLEKLDPEVLIALRMGFHQIHYLTRIPAYAIVNDSVNLTKTSGKASASRLVNAILRKIINVSIEFNNLNLIEKIALTYSHPTWLIKNWIDRYGVDQAEKLAQANNKPAPIYFRLNPLKENSEKILKNLTSQKLVFAPSHIISTAYQLIEGDKEKLLDFAEKGLIYIQDAASQLVVSLLEAVPNIRVFDVCAAPGGKTTLVATYMNNQGLILAGDLHLARIKLVKETAKRLGVNIIIPICYDASRPLPLSDNQFFDRVLVDAPCSGTGTLRHNPEIKYRLSKEKIKELAELQTQILDNSALLVSREGRLIYSTCSLEYEENEAVIEKFLTKHQDFQVIKPNLPDHLITSQGLITSEGFIRTWPYRDNTDGFFAAILARKNTLTS